MGPEVDAVMKIPRFGQARYRSYKPYMPYKSYRTYFLSLMNRHSGKEDHHG